VKRGRTDRETCELNGWKVGTRLVGDEGYGPTVIRIVYMDDDTMIARQESHNGEPIGGKAAAWTLTCREWCEVTA
jgi:hypothetical protein